MYDTCYVDISCAGEPAGRPRVAWGPCVAALRLHRQRLIAEHRRCTHLRRLLRARLDLTIAEAVDVPALGRALTTTHTFEHGLPSFGDMKLLVSGATHGPGGAPADLVDRLQELEDAIRRLSTYSDALLRDIDDATVRFVEALAADPASGLHQQLVRPALIVSAGVAPAS